MLQGFRKFSVEYAGFLRAWRKQLHWDAGVKIQLSGERWRQPECFRRREAQWAAPRYIGPWQRHAWEKLCSEESSANIHSLKTVLEDLLRKSLLPPLYWKGLFHRDVECYYIPLCPCLKEERKKNLNVSITKGLGELLIYSWEVTDNCCSS